MARTNDLGGGYGGAYYSQPCREGIRLESCNQKLVLVVGLDRAPGVCRLRDRQSPLVTREFVLAERQRLLAHAEGFFVALSVAASTAANKAQPTISIVVMACVPHVRSRVSPPGPR